MLAGRLRERAEIWNGLLSNQEHTTNKIIAFRPAVMNHQLPALPIFLELVIRKIKGCGFHNMLGFCRLWGWQRSICLHLQDTTPYIQRR